MTVPSNPFDGVTTKAFVLAATADHVPVAETAPLEPPPNVIVMSPVVLPEIVYVTV